MCHYWRLGVYFFAHSKYCATIRDCATIGDLCYYHRRFYARLIVFLFVYMFVSLSCRSEITMKGGVLRSDFFQNDWNWLRGCANWYLEEIRPEEVLLLQKWRKKLCSFSPYVGCPEKASIDQVAIWNRYPSQKIYIKCWNRKKIGILGGQRYR